MAHGLPSEQPPERDPDLPEEWEDRGMEPVEQPEPVNISAPEAQTPPDREPPAPLDSAPEAPEPVSASVPEAQIPPGAASPAPAAISLPRRSDPPKAMDREPPVNLTPEAPRLFEGVQIEAAPAADPDDNIDQPAAPDPPRTRHVEVGGRQIRVTPLSGREALGDTVEAPAIGGGAAQPLAPGGGGGETEILRLMLEEMKTTNRLLKELGERLNIELG